MQLEKHPDIRGVQLAGTIPLFPISWLHSLSYCEYQLYLDKFMKIEVEDTPEMVLGSSIHADLEKEHLEKATEEMTISDAIKRAETTGETFIAREVSLQSIKYGIYGKIDEVWMAPDKIVIIDDKPNDYPYLSLKRQVWGYCLCFEDAIKPGKTIVGFLRNRDNKNTIWEEVFNDEHRKHITDVILRTHDLIKGAREAEATDNPAKCGKCRFNKVCDKKIIF